MVTQATFITQPEFIYKLILTWHGTLNHSLSMAFRIPANVIDQVTSHGTMSTD